MNLALPAVVRHIWAGRVPEMYETVQIRCANCSARLEVAEKLIGQAIKCPKCQATIEASVESRSAASRSSLPATDLKKHSSACGGWGTLISIFAILALLGSLLTAFILSQGNAPEDRAIAIAFAVGGIVQSLFMFAAASGLSGIAAICNHLYRRD